MESSIHEISCLELFPKIPEGTVTTVITSPPYNIGKSYESRTSLTEYLAWQQEVIAECYRVLKRDGSVFWQVGNYVSKGEIWPLDMLLYPIFKEHGFKLRNRIVWHFQHGLHSSRRFSGRYEVLLWFTKSDDYYFDLDAVRVPQMWPGKRAYKGPRKGQLTCNVLGKNPSDVWEITNVKYNHPEKTAHPCQFPEALVKRALLATTRPGDLVLDPFAGSGTTLAVAKKLGRRSIGAEINPEYVEIARRRIEEVSPAVLHAPTAT